MKKLRGLTVALTMAVAFLTCSTAAFAAGPAYCGNYVDADGDGICDNRGTNGRGGRYVDAVGDGICDNRGMNGRGGRYVDADGDGICDNRGTNGCGGKYVDADGDGICDNAKYGIKYNLNGGKNNAKNPTCYYQTSKTIKLAKPTRKGYTFKGWYADKQYKKKVTSIKKGSAGNKTFYAKWKKN